MKTILFPTDFSMNSTHAIRYGLELFKGEDIKCILFNCYSDRSAGLTFNNTFKKEIKRISKLMLNRLKEHLQDDLGFKDITFQKRNGYGDLTSGVLNFLEKQQVDYIIIGSSGAGSPSIASFGSNALSLMKHTNIPVLTVPLQSPLEAPKEIGLASNEKFNGFEKKLDPLFQLAIANDSTVIGVHINKENAKPNYAMANGDEYYKLNYIELEMDNVLEGLEQAIGSYNLDMLCILRNKRGFFESLFHKSVLKEISKEISIPVLCIGPSIS